MTAAAGLEQYLRIVAKWTGNNPDEVKVTPNLDFAEARVEPRTIVELMTAKLQAAPLSLETIHEWLRENEFTKLTFDEEMERIAEESTMDFGPLGAPGAGIEGDPQPPEPTDDGDEQ